MGPTGDTRDAPRSAAPSSRDPDRVTRASAAWFATAVALVLLILLVVLILQNQESVELQYFGLTTEVPLGVALLIAAVGGALVVGIVGVVRLTQVRVRARRARRASDAGDASGASSSEA